MKPRAATDVLTTNFGDCKDKSNLMRTMLKAVGIDSYALSIYSGDPDYVKADWPSPLQFNHEIIAIKVPQDVTLPAVIDQPKLGKLLLFDPTDSYTAFGYLPLHEQGSLALIEAGDSGDLIKTPVLDAKLNHQQRTTEASLSPEGNLTVESTEVATGAPAFRSRAQLVRRTEAEYRKSLEYYLSTTIRGPVLKKVESKAEPEKASFQEKVAFEAASYAKLMQNRLMSFSAAFMPGPSGYFFNEKERQHALMLEADSFEETINTQLPEGFIVDELPEAFSSKTDFGNYSASWKHEGQKIVFKRKLRMERASVPATRYKEVQSFFQRIYGAEQSPVVLVRK
jgi:hypothetical protein